MKMKCLPIIAALVLLAGSASAKEICFDIPSGPGLKRLGDLCDWRRADPKINKPDMTDEECGERFFNAGAFEAHHEKLKIELRAQGKAALAASDAAFRSDLPMPEDGAPPIPTATPTATPTAEPTPAP